MKATQLLKKDHAEVKKLLTEFGRTSMRAPRRREQLLDKIATELEIHSTIEEQIFYPAVKDASPEGARLVSDAETEHEKVDGLVAAAQGMSMDSDDLTEKVKELRDAVVHHATEEEEMFPVAEQTLDDRLDVLGEEMGERKRQLATSRVHRTRRAAKKTMRKIA